MITTLRSWMTPAIPTPASTPVVVMIAVLAIVGQLGVNALTPMPWWGGLLTFVLVNSVVTPLMLWFNRRAKMPNPLTVAFEASTKAALAIISLGGAIYSLFALGMSASADLIGIYAGSPLSMLHLWLVQTFGASTIVLMNRRRAAKRAVPTAPEPPSSPLTDPSTLV